MHHTPPVLGAPRLLLRPLHRLCAALLLRLVAGHLVRRATANLPVLGFILFDSGLLDAVGTLAALKRLRPPASATIACSRPLRGTEGHTRDRSGDCKRLRGCSAANGRCYTRRSSSLWWPQAAPWRRVILTAHAPRGGRRRPRGGRTLPRERVRPTLPSPRYYCPIKSRIKA